MKREESRIRWTIEREVKLKMKEEEETRIKREIEFYRTEVISGGNFSVGGVWIRV